MSKLNEQVTAFHKKFGQPIGARPKVPTDAMVRFRLKLIMEEFFELFEAAFNPKHSKLDEARAILQVFVENGHLDMNFPEFVDALGDMDYINEGTRLVFGVDGDPVADEIQRANMAKDPAYVDAKDSYHTSATIKPVKPAGWTPPDIERVLIEQGWKP